MEPIKSLKKIRTALSWPMAAVLIAGGLSFAAILIWAPADAKDWLLGANGLFNALIAYFLRSPADVQQSSVSVAAEVVAAIESGEVPVVVSPAPVLPVDEVAPAPEAEVKP